ncbi:Bardet-Biedl syndrome 12 protein isoform X2 [Tympanuchus pallidicinctus]|nr:Bardet-Biedl syndrome 12 protein isoform X2 [Tympanuchus pallidicinctus]XP_052538599.1 Bardet-Biedl syndrome 12 protein isoform X2 [Tympanuchus pallidicinctus]XP_052538600.1 Bardet-Biedl syndrome 12 protein isoform X2 [Tympanuchus pallidicinctus]XP_052538601.1 Bardet-Biedl syndrome 12 protein isoform X2 [Tympanuchus pallidicinctus]XP_052538602.1 Bardet-Biedl syndrome 12 protein isoform X2 [Tympanuchus pallidicinctus]XP_052538604.1 Bardet-Biedl syndrome 12 protein isoform X2 [Tympanuchus pal
MARCCTLAMAFRAVNSRRHIGLQQLSSLAWAGRTLLGPMKSCKFVVDESTNESMLICSAVRLMESLDLTSAAGQLLNETIQAQNKEFKTGMSTLLFLVGAWSNAVLECLQQNVPVSAIVSVMSEGLDSCCEKVQCLQISIHDVNKELCSSSVRPRTSESKVSQIPCDSSLNHQISLYFQKDISASEELVPRNSCFPQEADCNFNKGLVWPLASFGSVASLVRSVDDKSTSVISGSGVSASICKQKVLTHSRYFSTVAKSHVSSHLHDSQVYLSGQSAYTCECYGLEHLAMALSHGNQPSMKLLQGIVAYQHERAECSGSSQFRIAEIATCCLPGLPESYSCVCPGFITLVSPEQATVITYFRDKSLWILLMDGDLTEQYRHLGFTKPRNVKTVLEYPSLQEGGSRDSWLSSTLDILISLEVNLVLVKGAVCKNLMERCIANNILVISSVTQNVLSAFGEVTGAQPVTYLTQLNAACLGSGVWVELWKGCDERAMELGQLVPVTIKVQRIPLLTAVLTTTVASKMQLIEDQFWTFVYRLHHALKDGKVFPGGGAVEFLCLSHIQMLAEQSSKLADKNAVKEFHSPRLAASSSEYKAIVLQALAAGWNQYLSMVMCNTAKAASEFEARTLIDHHLQKAAYCGSPSAYVLKEFRRGGMFRGGSIPFTDSEEGVKAYDNVTAKMEAWRRALDLVLLVLQTDAEIIIGPRRSQLLNSHSSSEFMFL